MKKLLFLLLLISSNLFAQVTKEKSYPGGLLSVVNVDGTLKFVPAINLTTRTVSVYNTDHTLFKTLTVPAVTDHQNLSSITNLSTKLFNTDGGYEFLVTYYNPTTGYYMSRILNEDGTLISQLDSVYSTHIISTPNGTKMIGHIYKPGGIYSSNVYSLPGTIQATTAQLESIDGNPYPNPATETVVLPYKLNTDVGTLSIINSAGVVVRSFEIGNYYQEIILNTSDMMPGIYHYTVSSTDGVVSGNPFIVQ